MKVSELIELLKELPQDKELPIEKEALQGENTDFNSGLLIGMTMMCLASLKNSYPCEQQKNRFSNIHGDFEKHVVGDKFTESTKKCTDKYIDA